MHPLNHNIYADHQLELSKDTQLSIGVKRQRDENFMLGQESPNDTIRKKRLKRGSFGDLPKSRSLPSIHRYDPEDATKAKRIFSSGSEINLASLKKTNSGKRKQYSRIETHGDESKTNKDISFQFGYSSPMKSINQEDCDAMHFKNNIKPFVDTKVLPTPKKRTFSLFSDFQ